MKRLEVSLGKDEVHNPSWETIGKFLMKFQEGINQLELGWYEVEKSSSWLVNGLFVQGDNGLYQPSWYYLDRTPRIMDYKNPNADDSWVELGPYEYPSEILTDDFDLIVSMFKEFYETGEVKALNHVYIKKAE